MGMRAAPMVSIICLALALPMKSRSIQLAPSNRAVDRFAGAINAQVMITGVITGRKPFLKSLITSCFLLISLARYMNRASLAKSDVCIVRFNIGSRIQRLPSFIRTPKNKV